MTVAAECAIFLVLAVVGAAWRAWAFGGRDALRLPPRPPTSEPPAGVTVLGPHPAVPFYDLEVFGG